MGFILVTLCAKPAESRRPLTLSLETTFSNYSRVAIEGSSATFTCAWLDTQNSIWKIVFFSKRSGLKKSYLTFYPGNIHTNLVVGRGWDDSRMSRAQVDMSSTRLQVTLINLSCLDEDQYICLADHQDMTVRKPLVKVAYLSVEFSRPKMRHFPDNNGFPGGFLVNTTVSYECTARVGKKTTGGDLRWKLYFGDEEMDLTADDRRLYKVQRKEDGCSEVLESILYFRFAPEHHGLVISCYVTNRKQRMLMQTLLPCSANPLCAKSEPVQVTSKVHETPVTITSDPDYIHEGEDLSLFCNAQGNPPPKYFWTKDDHPVKLRKHATTQTGKKLVLSNMCYNYDSGSYKCTASNFVNGRTYTTFGKINITVGTKVANPTSCRKHTYDCTFPCGSSDFIEMPSKKLCVHFSVVKTTYTNAITHCQLYKQSTLMRIEDREVEDELTTVYKRFKTTTTDMQLYWIALQLKGNNVYWLNDTKPANYSNIDPKYGYDRSEPCISKTFSHGGKWRGRKCLLSHQYICMKRKETQTLEVTMDLPEIEAFYTGNLLKATCTMNAETEGEEDFTFIFNDLSNNTHNMIDEDSNSPPIIGEITYRDKDGVCTRFRSATLSTPVAFYMDDKYLQCCNQKATPKPVCSKRRRLKILAPPQTARLTVEYPTDNEVTLFCSGYVGTGGKLTLVMQEAGGTTWSWLATTELTFAQLVLQGVTYEFPKLRNDPHNGPELTFSITINLTSQYDKAKIACSSREVNTKFNFEDTMEEKDPLRSPVYVMSTIRPPLKPDMNVSYHVPPSGVFLGLELVAVCRAHVGVDGSITWVLGSRDGQAEKTWAVSTRKEFRQIYAFGINITRAPVKRDKKGPYLTSYIRKTVELSMTNQTLACYSQYQTENRTAAEALRSASLPLFVQHLAQRPEMSTHDNTDDTIKATCNAYVGTGGNLTWELAVKERRNAWKITGDRQMIGKVPVGVSVAMFDVGFNENRGPFIKSVITIDKAKVARGADMSSVTIKCYTMLPQGMNDSHFQVFYRQEDLESSINIGEKDIEDLFSDGLFDDMEPANTSSNDSKFDPPHLQAARSKDWGEDAPSTWSSLIAGLAAFAALTFCILMFLVRPGKKEKPLEFAAEASRPRDDTIITEADDVTADATSDISRAMTIAGSSRTTSYSSSYSYSTGTGATSKASY